MVSDSALARAVDHGLRNHYVTSTSSTYKTATRDYVSFCNVRSLRPWPVDQVTFCGWLHVSARRIQISSLSMYMAGVRDSSILLGHGWDLHGNEMVRRSLRYLKRKYPSKGKGRKVPVTVNVLTKILPLLPGWPDMAAMSADDRVFACASVSAVAGFLRGGEFLTARKSTRAVLKARDVTIRVIDGRRAQVIAIPQPKAAWWVTAQSVPCFQMVPDETFCPVRLWEEYSARCPGFKPNGPAFLLGDKALTRDYMVSRTATLVHQAGVSFVDHKGVKMSVKAASWRSGAVCSAAAAGVPVPYIMILGRWSSSAWEKLSIASPPCACKEVQVLCGLPQANRPPSPVLWLESSTSALLLGHQL